MLIGTIVQKFMILSKKQGPVILSILLWPVQAASVVFVFRPVVLYTLSFGILREYRVFDLPYTFFENALHVFHFSSSIVWHINFKNIFPSSFSFLPRGLIFSLLQFLSFSSKKYSTSQSFFYFSSKLRPLWRNSEHQMRSFVSNTMPALPCPAKFCKLDFVWRHCVQTFRVHPTLCERTSKTNFLSKIRPLILIP